MEKVVYLLGAGFSAPLGLPVMSNFIEKSKDQYFADRERFKHFSEVFDMLNAMAVSKNYYRTDLFNIEDVLSIAEMRRLLGPDQKEDSAKEEKNPIKEYIKQVIEYYTPTTFSSGSYSEWLEKRLGDKPWRPHISFVAALLGYGFTVEDRIGPMLSADVERRAEYSVITLNYDTALETISGHIHKEFLDPDNVKQGFNRPARQGNRRVALAKLHGSVDSDDIVPPTWSKSLEGRRVLLDWRLAYELLKSANQIRIIGYSLPITDSYIKFLLRGAVMDSPHLKQIDVLCLDPDGSVKRRFDEFIAFPRYRFTSGRTEEYLKLCAVQGIEHNSKTRVNHFGRFETNHDKFFDGKPI